MKTLSQLLPGSLILESQLEENRVFSRITNHSEGVSGGDLYFAIKGTKVDGNRFVSDVVKSGAAVVIEDRSLFEKNKNAVLVRSTREALAFAASHWYENPSSKINVVGVTGTNGKTTTTYLLRSIWEELKCVSGMIGTVETWIGDENISSELTTPGPMELQKLFSHMVEKKVTHAAMEVSSIALDQFRTSGTEFKVGIFTNLTLDHLDYHGSLDNYRDTKLRFFQNYPMATAVTNIDDAVGEMFYQKTRAKNKLSFSLKRPQADFYVVRGDFTKDGTLAVVRTPKGEITLHLQLIGRHNLYNSIGALAATYALGQDMDQAAVALSKSRGAPGRLEKIMNGEEYPSIFVDYAHSDDALSNVLLSIGELRKSGTGRVITVFGCGGGRDRTKRPKMAEVVSKLSDITIATSDNPRTEDAEKIIDDLETGIVKDRTDYYREVSRKKAIHLALEMAKPSDFVLVAGKGHETYQIIGTEKFPFDDSKVIRDYYT